MVEHSAVNRGVVGSSPTVPAHLIWNRHPTQTTKSIKYEHLKVEICIDFTRFWQYLIKKGYNIMEQRLRALIKESMLAKKNEPSTRNSIRCQTFKNILEMAQKTAKEQRVDVTDSIIISAAKKEIKQQNDLLAFCKNDADKTAEINIAITTAGEILPAQVGENEIRAFLAENKNTCSKIGDAMKALREKYGDALDAKLASSIVREVLK